MTDSFFVFPFDLHHLLHLVTSAFVLVLWFAAEQPIREVSDWRSMSTSQTPSDVSLTRWDVWNTQIKAWQMLTHGPTLPNDWPSAWSVSAFSFLSYNDFHLITFQNILNNQQKLMALTLYHFQLRIKLEGIPILSQCDVLKHDFVKTVMSCACVCVSL